MREISSKLMLFSKKMTFNVIAFDVIYVFLLLYFVSETLISPQDSTLLLGDIGALQRFLWLASPVLFLYVASRVVGLPILFCAYILPCIIYMLTFVNKNKLALTGEPLSFNDLVSGFNLTVADKYLNSSNITVAILAVAVGVLSFVFRKKNVRARVNYFSMIIILILIAPFSFYPYTSKVFGVESQLTQRMDSLARGLKISYMPWNWVENARLNGLPMHLIQTSVRGNIPKATVSERELYNLGNISTTTSPVKHKTIIYVLCEACWYDENNFKEIFLPLLTNGFSEFRAMSPLYGGGTANAEFEMLTGLPSRSNILSGIIYQEYAKLMKSNANSLASAIKTKGFETYAAHNYHRTFWFRDVVYQKFGFDKFDGLSDMGELQPQFAAERQSWQWQPDDQLLYDKALNELRSSSGNGIFMNLITMSTHGPYPYMNDAGEGAYRHQLSESVRRLSQFTKQVEEIDHDAVIVVYGDHKPSINKYFIEHDVLLPNYFQAVGDKNEDFIFKEGLNVSAFGDVPVLIKSNNSESVRKLIYEANNKPFFCVSSIIDKYFINSGLFAFNYNRLNGCHGSQSVSYEEKAKNVPAWLFSLSLFEN